MAIYPTLGQDMSSSENNVDDVQIEYSTNGSLRGRSFFNAPVKEFTVVHTVDMTDRSTLEAFYLANRAIAFSFTYVPTGITYNCIFKGPIQFTLIGQGYWTATATLVDVGV